MGVLIGETPGVETDEGVANVGFVGVMDVGEVWGGLLERDDGGMVIFGTLGVVLGVVAGVVTGVEDDEWVGVTFVLLLLVVLIVPVLELAILLLSLSSTEK